MGKFMKEYRVGARDLSAGFRRGAGFTLIELLVVVAIITVLMGILLPSLKGAREQARRSVCLTNLKQISSSAFIYEQSWGTLPGPSLPCILDPQYVNGELKATNTTWYKASQTRNESYLSEIITSRKVWLCPSSSVIRETAKPATGSFANTVVGFCYKLNNSLDTYPTYMFGSWSTSDSEEKKQPKKLVSLQNGVNTTSLKAGKGNSNPAAIWMVSDIDGLNFDIAATGTFGMVTPKDMPYGQRPYQPGHSSGEFSTTTTGRNYAYFDGHAEYVTYKNWPTLETWEGDNN